MLPSWKSLLDRSHSGKRRAKSRPARPGKIYALVFGKTSRGRAECRAYVPSFFDHAGRIDACVFPARPRTLRGIILAVNRAVFHGRIPSLPAIREGRSTEADRKSWNRDSPSAPGYAHGIVHAYLARNYVIRVYATHGDARQFVTCVPRYVYDRRYARDSLKKGCAARCIAGTRVCRCEISV